MATLEQLRQVIGDDVPPYDLSIDDIRATAELAGYAFYLTGARLRNLLSSRSADNLGPAWNVETERLQQVYQQESMGAFSVVGQRSTADVTILDLGDITGGPMLLSVAAREDASFGAADFSVFVIGDTVTTPTFTDDMYVAFAVSYPPTAIELGFDQMAAFVEDGVFQDGDGRNFAIWRSRIALADAWSNVEVELRP